MKKVLYVILGLIVLYLILCLIGPKETRIERSVSINAKPEVIMRKLQDFKFFTEEWSPWTEKDPQMKRTYEGEPGKPGHKYSWEGNKDVGKGYMELLGVNGDTIKQKLNLMTWHVEPDVYMIAQPEGEGTKVTWGMIMKNGFIHRGMGLFFNPEKMMAPDFEHGLDRLKKAIESMPAEPMAANYEVKEEEWPETNFVGSKRETIGVAEMPAYFAKHFPAIMQSLEKEKIKPEMAPTALYWSFDNKTMKGDLAAVFKVANGVKLKGFENYSFPAGKVLHISYYGNYDKIGDAHMAMDAYMKEKGIEKHTAVFEEYASDPGTQKDTTKWLTNIYYLLPAIK